ncbi:MAG: Mov34/MPN/PAD-1 family protein [Promethearchaeota archaeon]
MPQVFVDPTLEPLIEGYAKTTEKEIYGWLIGFDDRQNNVYIISVIDCQRYAYQELIGVGPDPIDTQMVYSAMPQRIGVVGIYHSHPGEVFHSHIDDRTLISLSKLYQNPISVVTNGTITKYYQVGHPPEKMKEIDAIRKKIKKLQFMDFMLNVKKTLMVDTENPLPEISSQLHSWVEENFIHCVYSRKGINIDMNSKLSNLLSEKSLISLKLEDKTVASIVKEDSKNEMSHLSIDLDLFAKVFVKEEERLSDLSIDIKEELIQDLLLKTAKGSYDPKRNEFIPANLMWITYLGIPLKAYVTPYETAHSFLEDMIKRAKILFKIEKKLESKELLVSLEKIFKEIGAEKTLQKIYEIRAHILRT